MSYRLRNVISDELYISAGSARLVPLNEVTPEEWAEKTRMSLTRGEGKIEGKNLGLIL